MKRVLSILCVLSLSAHGMTLDESTPFKKTNCKIGPHKAQLFLRFDKKLAPATNDYAGAPLVYLKSKQTHHEIESNPNTSSEFLFTSPKNNKFCDGTLAFSLTKDILALIYTKDNRPFHSIQHVIVWDAKNDKILYRQELGSIVNSFPIKGGFAFVTVIPRSDVGQMETTSPSGKKMLAGDDDLKAIHVFSMEGANPKIFIDPDRSFRYSEWKKFFKNKSEYLKYIGWNAETKTIKNNVVYKATYFNRSESDISETCINLTDARDGKFENEKWRCIQEKQ